MTTGGDEQRSPHWGVWVKAEVPDRESAAGRTRSAMQRIGRSARKTR